MFEFSRRLAWVYALALPVVETARRWHQLGDPSTWPVWLDDFLLAALLFAGARLTSESRYQNAKYLAAAWGVTCGMAYGSFFNSFLNLDVPDPGPLSTTAVALIKSVGFALAILALIGSLKPPVKTLDSTDDA